MFGIDFYIGDVVLENSGDIDLSNEFVSVNCQYSNSRKSLK